MNVSWQVVHDCIDRGAAGGPAHTFIVQRHSGASTGFYPPGGESRSLAADTPAPCFDD
jgi:hypothetical protein